VSLGKHSTLVLPLFGRASSRVEQRRKCNIRSLVADSSSAHLPPPTTTTIVIIIAIINRTTNHFRIYTRLLKSDIRSINLNLSVHNPFGRPYQSVFFVVFGRLYWILSAHFRPLTRSIHLHQAQLSSLPIKLINSSVSTSSVSTKSIFSIPSTFFARFVIHVDSCLELYAFVTFIVSTRLPLFV
jgi:hypothetical protein